MNSQVFNNLSISIDSDELNPLLTPDVRGHLTVRGTASDGAVTVIPNEKVTFFMKTIFTCDDAQVAEVTEGGEVIPLNGGLVRVSAEYICGGTGRTTNELDVIVRPFYHEYHRTLTYKLFLAMEPFGSMRYENDGKRDDSVYLDFDEALDVIRRLDAITNGMPKIVYLVGWQTGGHDHLYPYFNEVNPRLKGKNDATARDSMRRIMREAKKYNTTVSVHINFIDAWDDSPGWKDYLDKGILAINEDGTTTEAPGDAFSRFGVHCTVVEMTPMWNTGEFHKRMDELFTLLPELYDAHTIHIDNWRAEPCPALGITKQDEENTMRKIFAWFREHGIDCTSEGSFHGRTEPMTGLQPMTWFDAPYSPEMPASLYCGGRKNRTDDDPRFGDTLQIEGSVKENLHRHRDPLDGIQCEYCICTMAWEFLNHFRLLSFDGTTATYSDGLKAYITEGGIPEIFWNETRIRKGTTMFVPLLFKEDREIVLYSFRDSACWLHVPKGWEDVESVDIYYLDPLGREEPQLEHENYALKHGNLEINAETRCALLIKPHGEK